MSIPAEPPPGFAPGAPDNRRESLRIEAELPFRWMPTAADWDAARLAEAFGLSDTHAAVQEMHRLDTTIEQDLDAVSDPPTRRVLMLLLAKTRALAEILDVRTAPPPERQPITLSAEGIGFTTTTAPAVGSRIGLRLVLPHQQIVEFATVVHHAGRRVGVRLDHPEGVGAQHLARYVMSR